MVNAIKPSVSQGNHQPECEKRIEQGRGSNEYSVVLKRWPLATDSLLSLVAVFLVMSLAACKQRLEPIDSASILRLVFEPTENTDGASPIVLTDTNSVQELVTWLNGVLARPISKFEIGSRQKPVDTLKLVQANGGERTFLVACGTFPNRLNQANIVSSFLTNVNAVVQYRQSRYSSPTVPRFIHAIRFNRYVEGQMRLRELGVDVEVPDRVPDQ